MNARHVIITADDYGMCDSVNAAIDACIERRSVTSTNVMVNMPSRDAAGTFRRRFPRVPLGLHWTLSQGRPVLPPARVATLVDRGGSFHPAAEFRRRWTTGRLSATEITAELRAQHRAFVELAGPPDYWNTHENTHVFPGLFPLFVRTGLDCGIRAMRCHRRIVVPVRGSAAAHLIRHPVFLAKGLLIGLYSQWAERLSVWMPRGLICAPGFDRYTEIAQILASPALSEPTQPVEFVVHPSIAPEAQLFGALVETRVAEYRMLTDSGLERSLAQSGVTLCTYPQIGLT